MAKVVDARDLKSLGGNPIRVRVPVPASSVLRTAMLMVFANAFGLILFLRARADSLMSAVVDPLHPDWNGMEQAFAGFTIYAVCLLSVLAIGALIGLRAIVRGARRGAMTKTPTRVTPSLVALAVALTAGVVLVFIEVLLFQDYGIHFYEFDVFGILANAALRRDLGIQPAEVARVVGAAIALLAVEIVLCFVAARAAAWRNGAVARACVSAMLVAIPGGLSLFYVGEKNIASDRGEFESALPLGRELLLRSNSRPFIAVTPRLGQHGYPVLGETTPTITKRKNIVFFVADGLRGDMVRADLTPNLLRFGARQDVITSRRHYSTGHVSEAGIFGLEYGINAQAFNSFVEQRVPAYPLELLKRNGYLTLLVASSRLSPYPSDQLVRGFDQVIFAANDDAAIGALRDYVAARTKDGTPYFVLAFMYTPHYPFTSAKPPFRHFPIVGPSARSNYMNDVLQADDFFRQALTIVQPDYDAGRTALLATADHGEEIRDHGIFGHARATFWNEKIVVPFFLGMPGAAIPPAVRRQTSSSHVDVWPTLFDYMAMQPRLDPVRYSDGRSLFDPARLQSTVYVAGRFFPYADRPSVLVTGDRKYWFRVDGMDASGGACIVRIRTTDLNDRAVEGSTDNSRSIPALDSLKYTLWRFILPTTKSYRSSCAVK
jgi:hypothetical protein